MLLENEILHRCLFLWDALSVYKLEPRKGSFNDTDTFTFQVWWT